MARGEPRANRSPTCEIDPPKALSTAVLKADMASSYALSVSISRGIFDSLAHQPPWYGMDFLTSPTSCVKKVALNAVKRDNMRMIERSQIPI